jgi:hypothetical protein
MSDPSEPLTEGTGAHHSRSGDDITEAVEVAERGSAVEDLHDQPERNKSGQAPVEQAAGDRAMTEGQVVGGEGGGSDADPATPSSGAAQSQRGARASDLAAASDD